MYRFGLLLACAGCSPSDAALSVATDGGSYEVTLDALPEGPGKQMLSMSIDPPEGQLSEVEVSMPSMGHGSDGVVSDKGGGRYDVEIELSMSGLWVLDGLVEDEGFQLEIDVP